MLCSKCGNQLPDDVTSCTECGAPVEFKTEPAEAPPPSCEETARPTQKKRKKSAAFGACVTAATALVLVAALFLTGVIAPAGAAKSGSNTRLEGPGFKTPEAAVAAYMDAFANADFNAMISACAIETAVDNYSRLTWRG